MNPTLSVNATTAGEICTRDVVFADRGMMLGEAARMMRVHHVGSLVVVDECAPTLHIVVGIITDRDIATAVVAADRDPHAFRVGDVMSADPVTARESDSVPDLLAAMRRKRVRRVPVVGPQGELLGIVAIDDLLTLLATQIQALATQIQALAAAVGAAQRHEAG